MWHSWPGGAAEAAPAAEAVAAPAAGAAAVVSAPEVLEANIHLDLAPNQAMYDAADPELRGAAALLQKVRLCPDQRSMACSLLSNEF